MKTYLVLTLIGKDQPGLVESLSSIVAEHHGNWLESNMSRLAGQFAGILRVSVNADRADALVAALEALSPKLRLVVERSSDGDTDAAAQRTLKLSLVGNDRPGIIRDISSALARQQVNMDELETECVPAPMSSDILFRAEAVLHIPAGLDIDGLRAELERLADDLIVDINLED